MTWTTATLGEVAASVDYGLTASAAPQPVGPKFLRITDIQNDDVDWDKVPFCQASEGEERANSIAPGDILFARTGATTGKSFLVRTCPDRAVFASYLIRVRPSEQIDPIYLSRFFQSEDYWAQIRKSARGAAQPGVNSTVLKELVVPFPSLDEQRRIAAILDQADDLRRMRRHAVDFADRLAIACFRSMFSSEEWDRAALGVLCQLVRGSSPRPQGDPRFFGGPVPRLMIADVTRDGMWVTPSIDSLTTEGAKRSRPMIAGSVVMAVSGAVGLPAILAVDACIHDGFVGFRNLDPSLTNIFLYYWLLSMRTTHMASGTGAIWVNLTTDQVSQFALPLPSLDLQLAFAARIAQIDKLKAQHRAHLAKLDALFTSLQHRAFRATL